MFKRILVFGAACLFNVNCFAGSLTCDNVVVEHIAYHANNRLLIKLDKMNTSVFFCSPESEWAVSGTTYKMGAESCKAVFSMLLTAKTTGQSIRRVHFDGDDVPDTCDGWSNWSSAVIRYVNF